MDFSLTDEQALLLESFDSFLDNCGFDEAYLKKCWEESRSPAEYEKALVDLEARRWMCRP